MPSRWGNPDRRRKSFSEMLVDGENHRAFILSKTKEKAMTTKIDYTNCPEHVRDSLELYVEEGFDPGGFLSAVLENKLMESVARADNQSLHLLSELVRFINWELPGGCYGSESKVKSWRGLQNMGVRNAN